MGPGSLPPVLGQQQAGASLLGVWAPQKQCLRHNVRTGTLFQSGERAGKEPKECVSDMAAGCTLWLVKRGDSPGTPESYMVGQKLAVYPPAPSVITRECPRGSAHRPSMLVTGKPLGRIPRVCIHRGPKWGWGQEQDTTQCHLLSASGLRAHQHPETTGKSHLASARRAKLTQDAFADRRKETGTGNLTERPGSAPGRPWFPQRHRLRWAVI